MFDTLTRMGASGAGGDYEIERSLRFDDASTTKLNFTPSSAGNRRTFTLSFWIKATSLVSDGCIFEGDTTQVNGFMVQMNASGTYEGLYLYDHGVGSFQIWGGNFRDQAAWYHLVLAVDTTQATDTNRFKVYINGVQQDLSTWEVGSGANRYPPENGDFDINQNGLEMQIGKSAGGGTDHYQGYLADFHSVDGTQLTAESFGKTNVDTGQWIPKKYAGSYGTNGFYLNFSDNSGTTATTLGKDSSGNGNNWTPTNFSVAAGVGDDSSLDTPTNNCCTMSNTDHGGITVSNGGLDMGGNTQDKQARASWALPASGKYYWEVTATTITSPKYQGVGIAHITSSMASAAFATDGFKMYGASGEAYHDPDDGSWGAAWSDGDVISIAVDMDAGKIWAAKNGTWQESGNPATGANPLYDNFLAYSVNKQWHPAWFAFKNGNVASFNFGQRAFTHTVPTGYGPLSVATIPEPTIKKGSDHFVAKAYTGTGSTQTITTGIEADWVWVKRRGATNYHILANTLSGHSDYLVSNNQDAESHGGGSQLINGFSDTGFQVGTENAVNASGATGTYISWNWKAGGSPSNNTDGSATTSVSVNATAGFSIVKYTGTGSAQTLGHGLGVAPEMIIQKNLATNNKDWRVYHTGMGAADKFINLNIADAEGTANSVWNNTAPTSTVFSVADDGASNGNGNDLIAWCFSSVEGYSKVGSYVGKASTTAPFVWTGFTPAYILIKNSDSATHWNVFDTARDPYNQISRRILANEDGEEVTNHSNYNFGIYSNGFIPETTSADKNQSGNTFLYLAFAERPFKYANAR